jgi:hypothetical protein
MEGKNRESFNIDIVAQGRSLNAQEGQVMHGVIAASEEDIDLNVYVQSEQRGECMAYFFIEIEDGAPVTFQVVCNFRGPIVLCHQPLVDFGLVKVNTLEQYQMEIENTSPIPAQVLIKNSLNKNLGFDNMMSTEQAAGHVAQDSTAVSLIYDRPNTTKKGNQITVDQCVMVLKPHEKQRVRVSLKSARPETVEEYFEIMVEDGLSQFFQVHSEVQRPHVALNRAVVDLGRIYAGVTEYINPQSKH